MEFLPEITFLKSSHCEAKSQFSEKTVALKSFSDFPNNSIQLQGCWKGNRVLRTKKKSHV